MDSYSIGQWTTFGFHLKLVSFCIDVASRSVQIFGDHFSRPRLVPARQIKAQSFDLIFGNREESLNPMSRSNWLLDLALHELFLFLKMKLTVFAYCE